MSEGWVGGWVGGWVRSLCAKGVGKGKEKGKEKGTKWIVGRRADGSDDTKRGNNEVGDKRQVWILALLHLVVGPIFHMDGFP